MNQASCRIETTALDFRLLFESAPGLYLVLSATTDFIIVAASEAFLHKTMKKREEILGRRVFDVFPDNPDDPKATGTENWRVSLMRVLQNHEPDTMSLQKYDILNPDKEGGGFEERFWRPVNSPVFDSSGKIAYIIHRTDDVTEFFQTKTGGPELPRKTALPKRALFALGEESKIWCFLRYLLTPLVLVSMGLIAQHYLRSLVGGKVFLLLYPAVFVSAVLGGFGAGIIATVVATLGAWYYFVPFIYSFRLQSGSDLFGITIFSVMGILFSIFGGVLRSSRMRVAETQKDRDASIKKLQLTNRELAVRENERTQLLEKNNKLNHLKTQFFANVSHELRTPLTLILGPVESLLSRVPSDEFRLPLEMIRRNALGLLKQVNDLLDVAKLDAGKVEVKYSEIDLAKLVRRVASNFNGVAQQKRCKFSVECPDTVTAQIDTDKVERVLVNLIANAFKFTPDNGTVRCTLRKVPSEQRVVIEVADSGPGVPEKYRDSIFERFYQIEEDFFRRFGGTGLGLTIVKDYVEIQHGCINVGTAPEGGALFTVKIPLMALEGTPLSHRTVVVPPTPLLVAEAVSPVHRYKWEQVRPPKPFPGAFEMALRKPTILVVDDSPDMREYICETLGSEFLTETANSGHEGLEKARTIRPDLIVSDIMMPEMSGDQLFNEIRAIRELKAIPIILVTAKVDDELRIELLRKGAVDYLIKPFVPEELRCKTRNFLAVKAAEAKYRGLMESAQDSIVVVDSDGKIRFANYQTTSWFGYSKEELIDQPLEILVPERFRALHVGQRKEYQHDPTPRQMAERMADLSARRKDGSEFPVSIALSPMQTPEGLLVTAVIRDISEMKKLLAQTILAREEAIATVSHDLKNPLTAIQMSVQFLRSKLLPTDQKEWLVEKTLTTVERASEQMTSLIQDLLDYSKVESHRLTVEKKPEDASSLISEVFGVFEPLARDKSIDLRREIGAGLVTVFCERRRIVRVLSNLISNAIKFTPVGGTVTMLAELKNGAPLFGVRDTGAGISPEQLPHIFERYWQAEETARKGTGLGLAIAMGFVEAHHGKLWVESQVGRGSTFFFTLPMSKAKAA